MKRFTLILFSSLLTFYFSSCKKDSITPKVYPNFAQLKVGNYWVYERFNVDSLGNAIATGILDSCYVEKDTLINDINYFKVIRPEVLGSSFNDKFVRDSLHYLVNSVGQIIFSSQNFTDTFYSYFVTASLTDTICKVLVKMDDKNLSVSTPAGQFQTSSFKQNYIMYPNWANYGNTRQLDTRYAENIGIISETFPFYASDPNYVQRRLVRYKVN